MRGVTSISPHELSSLSEGWTRIRPIPLVGATRRDAARLDKNPCGNVTYNRVIGGLYRIATCDPRTYLASFPSGEHRAALWHSVPSFFCLVSVIRGCVWARVVVPARDTGRFLRLDGSEAVGASIGQFHVVVRSVDSHGVRSPVSCQRFPSARTCVHLITCFSATTSAGRPASES